VRHEKRWWQHKKILVAPNFWKFFPQKRVLASWMRGVLRRSPRATPVIR
jgi:hypothetical protein